MLSTKSALFQLILVLTASIFLYSSFRLLCEDSSLNRSEDAINTDIVIGQPYPNGDNIFFVETSCVLTNWSRTILEKERRVQLSPRAACALEAAVRAHPFRPVYVLHTCAVSDHALRHAPPYVAQALRRRNVRLWPVRFHEIFVGSPMQKWFESIVLQDSAFPVIQASYIVRYLLLWKYGGTYLDTDVIMLRSLRGKRNFAVVESETSAAAAVIDLGLDAIGRRVANACLDEIMNSYNGKHLADNGPGVITRTLQRLCYAKRVTAMSAARCLGFRMLPATTFFPSTRSRRGSGAFAAHVAAALEDEGAAGVHVGSTRASRELSYSELEMRTCPEVVAVKRASATMGGT